MLFVGSSGALFAPAPDTIVVSVRQSGVPRSATYLNVAASTGTLRAVGSSAIGSEIGLLPTAGDSTRFRFLWTLGGQRRQSLALKATLAPRRGEDPTLILPVERTATIEIDAPALAVTADEAIATSAGSTCWRTGQTVACGGWTIVPAADTDPTLVTTALRPNVLRFDEPVEGLHAVANSEMWFGAACARLVSGRTACWTALGPRTGLVPIDTGHPPFTRMRGSVGLDASGALWSPRLVSVWTGFVGRRVIVWQRLASDSLFVDMLESVSANGSPRCGITRSRALMCAPGVSAGPAILVPLVATTGAIRVASGFTDVLDTEGNHRLVAVRDTNGAYWAISVDGFQPQWSAIPQRFEPVGTEGALVSPCFDVASYFTEPGSARACTDASVRGMARLGLVLGSSGHNSGGIRACRPSGLLVCRQIPVSAGRPRAARVDTVYMLP